MIVSTDGSYNIHHSNKESSPPTRSFRLSSQGNWSLYHSEREVPPAARTQSAARSPPQWGGLAKQSAARPPPQWGGLARISKGEPNSRAKQSAARPPPQWGGPAKFWNKGTSKRSERRAKFSSKAALSEVCAVVGRARKIFEKSYVFAHQSDGCKEVYMGFLSVGGETYRVSFDANVGQVSSGAASSSRMWK